MIYADSAQNGVNVLSMVILFYSKSSVTEFPCSSDI